MENEKKFQRLQLQANKEAENTMLKTFLNKNPHEVWSKTDVSIKKNSDEVRDKFEQVFKEDLKRV